jgi:hypothetical protein
MAWNEKVARHIIGQLEKRNLEGSYVPSAAQARDEVLAMIPKGSKVYRGGSMTLVYMGVWDEVAKIPNVTILDPYQPGLTKDEAMEVRRQGLTADIMIASSNAITLDGRLVNLDATGNRVAGITFGPKKVILVVGMNKVTPDLESAMARVKHYVAPVNAIRLGLKDPCAETGLCSDCSAPQRICRAWSIIEGQNVKDRIHVKLVGETLGY